MSPIKVWQIMEQHACQQEYKYQRLYRNLYKNIATSQGSMTAGTDGSTIDNMSMAPIHRIIVKLKDHPISQTQPDANTLPRRTQQKSNQRPVQNHGESPANY
jgi:hypothetical protein